MSRKGKKALLLACAGVALLALAIPKFAPSGGPGSPQGGARPNAPGDQRMPVRVQVVRLEKLGDKISTVGNVLSNEEIEIRSQVAGQIKRISFKEGGWVRKGDLLLKINDDELQAQLLRARSRQEIAERQAERQHQLFEKNFVSEEEYNNAMNELNVVRAEAQLIKAQIDKTEIVAPFDGTIGLRHASEGSYISPAVVVATLQDNSRMKIDFSIPEKYAEEVKVGDKISFTVQTKAGRFEGRIYSREARIDQATRTLRVRAMAPNPRGLLLAGSFANIEVNLNQRETLTIPSFALIPELRGHKVFVYRNGRVESKPVEIGVRSEERVEVVQGLAPGDTLIISGILQLRPGMSVDPVEGDEVRAQ